MDAIAVVICQEDPATKVDGRVCPRPGRRVMG